LDAGTYALRLPGMDDPIRVTTHAEVFDDHFESHEFLSPGGRLFEQLGSAGQSVPDPANAVTKGTTWMVSDTSTGTCRFVVRRGDDAVPCDELNGILKAIDDDGPPIALDSSMLKPNDIVYVLA